MGKLAVGLIAFAAGAVVGGWFVKHYVETHAAGLFAQGAVDKIFGQGSTAGLIAKDIGDALQGGSS